MYAFSFVVPPIVCKFSIFGTLFNNFSLPYSLFQILGMCIF